MPVIPEFTPQERLAISRKAIIRHMKRHHVEHESQSNEELEEEDTISHASYSKLSLIKHALKVWWHRHPASMAVELSRPLLSEYARAHPFRLLGGSAAAGAAIAVLRPWRLLSAGGLVGAALKSSGLSSALISTLASVNRSHESTPSP